jgi:hypothetical protein
MTLNTLALTAPIPASPWSEHPALVIYRRYDKDFSQNLDTCDLEKYYNAGCKLYHTDRSLAQRAGNLWSFFGSLYTGFPYFTREALTLLVVSDSQAGTHTIHAEMVTTLFSRGKDHEGVAVPQTFVYTLGRTVSFSAMEESSC